MTTEERLQIARIAADLLRIALENAPPGRKGITGANGRVDHEKVSRQYAAYFELVRRLVAEGDGGLQVSFVG